MQLFSIFLLFFTIFEIFSGNFDSFLEDSMNSKIGEFTPIKGAKPSAEWSGDEWSEDEDDAEESATIPTTQDDHKVADHENRKRKALELLASSPLKNHHSYKSPSTKKAKLELVDTVKGMINTPQKSKAKYAALTVVTHLPSNHLLNVFRDRLLTIKESEVSGISPTTPETMGSSRRDSVLSTASTVSGEDDSPLLDLQNEIDRVAPTPDFVGRLKKRSSDLDYLKTMKDSLDLARESEPSFTFKPVDIIHLKGEAHGGGHLFTTQEAFDKYVKQPTLQQVGLEPSLNPENGVITGYYLHPDNTNPKFSTIFPTCLSESDIYSLVRDAKAIANKDNRILEVGTTLIGQEIPMELFIKPDGLLYQAFPIWSLKDWSEELTIPGIEITPDEILAQAKAEYNKILVNDNSPIRYETDDFIIFDAAKLVRNPLLPKGAYVKIAKELLN